MELKIGDKIKLKSYHKVVEMYENSAFNNMSQRYPIDSGFIYGIFWEDYREMCKGRGEIIEVNKHDYTVIFDGELEFDIPLILIQGKNSIDLPDNLFEL